MNFSLTSKLIKIKFYLFILLCFFFFIAYSINFFFNTSEFINLKQFYKREKDMHMQYMWFN